MKPRGHPIRAIVFDLDGTLVDSLPLVLRAIAHAIEPFSPPYSTEEIFARLGGPPESFLPGLVGRDNVRTALERMDAYHRKNDNLVQPFANVSEMLITLRANGVRVAVWTGRDRASGEELLRSRGLRDHFSAVVYGDDLPTHKPDPAGLQSILRELALPAHEVVFVGDADVDVQGGVACAVDTLLIRHGRAVPDDIEAVAWRMVASPEEAYALLLSTVGGTGSAGS